MKGSELIKIEKLLNKLWKYSSDHQVSDVYFLPTQKGYVIKLRFLNRIVNYRWLNFNQGNRCINYCKFYSGMTISEHRRPQLGSIKLNSDCSLRFSTVGDYLNRESMVARLIKNLGNQHLHFMIPDQFQRLRSLARQRGLMLFAGPTGSGKTTTIYKLAEDYGSRKMVMTIEDPVEIIKDDFLQLQINQKAGMGYPELLKVGLRHRPDIFIIGEIRDSHTAKAAIQAALSGHLVLSTVHAQSPEGVLDRLEQLGVEGHYIKQCLNSVAYQRLIPDRNLEMGALFNVVSNQRLFSDSDYKGFLNEWRRDLRELVKKKRINSENYTRYQFG